jgi:hypothetical protein
MIPYQMLCGCLPLSQQGAMILLSNFKMLFENISCCSALARNLDYASEQ